LAGACRPGPPPGAQASLGAIRISAAYAFAPFSAEEGAAYFRVRNTGSAADTLLAVSSPLASMGMFHRTMGSTGPGVMETIPLPAGGEVVLEPGGIHLMLMGLSQLPKAGDSLELRFHFAHAGDLTLRVPVRAYGQ
jgi:copper(I)-binding protein